MSLQGFGGEHLQERVQHMGREICIALAGAMLAMATGCGDHAAHPFERFRDDARRDYQAELAQPQPADSLPAEPTLGDYTAYAMMHSAALEASFNHWQAALQRIPQARALPDPQLSYRYYISEVETRVGAMRQGVGVSQRFPWIEKLMLREDAAAQAARAAHANFQAQRWQLAQRVAEAYWELYYLDQSIAVVGENRRLVEHLEGVARTRYKTATASHPEVIRAQVELGKLGDRYESLQDLRGQAVAELNAALNRPTETPVPHLAPGDDEFVTLDNAEMLRRLEEANPRLAAMQAEVRQREHEIQLARQAYIPDLTLGVDYTDINDSTAGRHPSDDGKDAVAVMASINLPIWYEKLNAGVREARHRHYAAMLTRQQTLADLAARVRRAGFDYRDAQRKYDLYSHTLLPKARQLVKAREGAFRGGTASFLDLVDAQRVLLEFNLAVARARADRGKSLARIEALLGQSVTSSHVADQ